MKVHIHTIHFTAKQYLINFIEKKVHKLEKFYDRVSVAEVFLKIDGDEKISQDKIAEIKLNVPGHTFFSSYCSDSFESAVDGATEGIRRQIKKHKGKLHSKKA